MIDFKAFYQRLSDFGLTVFQADFEAVLEQRFHHRQHGELALWLQTIAALPLLTAEHTDFSDTVTIGAAEQLNRTARNQLYDCLQLFHPWRKGPFNLFGIVIDSEWRSNLKWQRIAPHLQSLTRRKVLDVGCGNGYYCWRMLEQQPQWVLGIDPSQKFMMQFQVMKRYMPDVAIDYLPLRSEDLPKAMAIFDTVFSMGVLYHRRSPFDHLEELKQCLRPGGELVLETLVIDGEENDVLVPSDRYAQMRNTWFIPSVLALHNWLRRMGFIDIKLADVSRTTTDEQRTTKWMRFHSLSDYLDPHNPEQTIEGYSAPLRATFVARRPTT